MANTFLHPPRIEPVVKPKNGIVQPPVMPTAKRPGRHTNQLKYLLEKVANAVWDHELSAPFREPVDAKKLQLPDYHKKIKRAMDLGTIKKRLENGYYWRSSEAIEDFDLVFRNCYEYNNEGDEVIAMAKKLEGMFQAKLKQMPKVEKEIEAPHKKDRRKTVSFAPNVTIAEPPVYRSEEKKPKPRKKVAETVSPTDTAAEIPNKPESQPQSKARSKSRKENAEESPEPTMSIETMSIETMPVPDAPKARGRRKTILQSKAPNVDEPTGTTTSTQPVPVTLEQQSIEPVAKERKKIGRPAKPRKQAEQSSGASSTPETNSDGNIEKLTKSPIESSEALTAKEPKRTVAPKKSRKKGTEKSSEATTSTEAIPNENLNEIPVTSIESPAVEEHVEKLPSDERVENVKESQSNNRVGNRPNQQQNPVQLDELNERGTNDSGVDSIPEESHEMSLRMLEKKILAMQSELQKLMRLAAHKFGCFNEPPSKRARTDCPVVVKDEIEIPSSEIDKSHIDTSMRSHDELSQIVNDIQNLPDELYIDVVNFLRPLEPTLEDLKTGKITLLVHDINPSTVRALKLYLGQLQHKNAE